MFSSNSLEFTEAYKAADSLEISKKIATEKVLAEKDLKEKFGAELKTRIVNYTFTVDTRDCIGQTSLSDTQYIAKTKGIRAAAAGQIFGTSGPGTYPMVISSSNITDLKQGDKVKITGTIGNTAANGIHTILSVVPSEVDPEEGIFTISRTANRDYYSGGRWVRAKDLGYPEHDNNLSIIDDNAIIAAIPGPIKGVSKMALYNIIIPRDIIPLEAYLPDFIQVATSYKYQNFPGTATNDYEMFIKQEPKYLRSRMLGFYSSPLDIWRSYIDGNMSMPDSVTAAPLGLWNSVPSQPVPYPFQTVPVYRSKDFEVPGEQGFFHVKLSGYGVVDLLDWTYSSGSPTVNAITTSIMRKLLLILICPKQSYRDQDYVTLILNSNTTTPGDDVYPFGYGDYQRFVPCPGIQMNYNPGTNLMSPGDPTVSSVDSPVPFPNFRGNVFGPYSGPGQRFQSNGVRTCIQDLYLNGDLNNLHGTSFLLPDIPVEGIPFSSTYGLNFLSTVEVNLGNFQTSTNLNIRNCMRIVPNGFGTAVVRAAGNGSYYINKYNASAGGQGPSDLGRPSTWSDKPLYEAYNDPIAKGPSSSKIGPENTDGTGASTGGFLTSYYDLGPNAGQFIDFLLKYIEYAVNDIPDNDLVIRCDEIDSERGFRNRSTNSKNGPALLDTAIRLNIGSANGTVEYIESVQSMVSMCDGFWATDYHSTVKIEKLHLRFYTYDGIPIPIEKMLQPRRTTNLLLLLNRLSVSLGASLFDIPFLFDPLNPRLMNRVKRYVQLIIKMECSEEYI